MSESGTPKKRGRGRPSISSTEKKNYTISFRARGDIKERLEYIAEKTGRSLSEEVESILSMTLPLVASRNLPERFLPSVPEEMSNQIRLSYEKIELFINLNKACSQAMLQLLIARTQVSALDEETKQATDELLEKINKTKSLLNTKLDSARNDFDSWTNKVDAVFDKKEKSKK